LRIDCVIDAVDTSEKVRTITINIANTGDSIVCRTRQWYSIS